MKLLSKKTAVLAIAALVAVGAFITAPSAEAHDRDRGGWGRHDRGHHNGWRNNDHHRGWGDRGGWGEHRRGPRHHYSNSGWGSRRFESRRRDWGDRRYYR